MKKIFLFLLLIWRFPCGAQLSDSTARFTDELNLGLKNFYAGNLGQSKTHFETSLLYNAGKNPLPYSFLGEIYFRQQNFSKAASSLAQSVRYGNRADSLGDFFIDGISGDTKIKELQALAKILPALNKYYRTNRYDVDGALLFSKCKELDQYVRTKPDIDSPGVTAEMARIDTSVNLPRILEYAGLHGMPDFYALGDAQNDMFIVLHHLLQYSGPDVVRLEAYLLEAIRSGRYPVKDYLVSLDYRQSAVNGKQLYGTYVKSGPGGSVFYPPIDDIAHVDERRKRWHQLSLYDMARYRETPVELPKEYRYDPDRIQR